MPGSSSPPSSGQLLLDLIPRAMQAIRSHIRSQRMPELSVPQFRVLGFVHRHPGASLSDAAAHVGLGKPSMSTLVEALVRRGLLTRMTSDHDRRRQALALSRQGVALLERARAGALALLDARLATLGPAQRGTVVEALRILRPLFTDDADPVSRPEPLPAARGRRRTGERHAP
jgi:DNA-binding MarR family transcriptional regulator